MSRSSPSALVCSCCAVLAGCDTLDLYGTFVTTEHRDAGALDAAQDAALAPQVPPAAIGAASQPGVAQSPSTIGSRPSASSASDSDGGATLVPVIAAVRDSICLRGGSDTSACEAARELAFGHAVCSCASMLGTGSLSTETLGAITGLAAVGTNGAFTLRISRSSAADAAGIIDGSLVASGLGPSAVTGIDAEIRGRLELAAGFTFAGDVRVTGPAYSRTYPRGSGSLRIAGDLYHGRPPGLSLPPNVMVGGTVLEADIRTAPPCACGVASAAELVSAIAAAVSGNDGAREPLELDGLGPVTGTGGSVSLSCGRYSVAKVESPGSLTLLISGKVVIFVVGDFVVHGDVAVSLAPGAELDLVIGGDLRLSGAARFGDADRPAASRVYVRGAVELSTMADAAGLARPSTATGDAVFVGHLYAPAATLELAPRSDVYGSLFVSQLIVLQSLFVHYDPAATLWRGVECGS